MSHPIGPGSPFQLLFDDEESLPASLPHEFREIYPGDWRIPAVAGRPYTYSNFGMSRDGRISFNEPGKEAAYHVTKGDPHDRWLMGLLRARADAIMCGDTTVRLETDHFWTAEFIFPPEAEAFADLRRSEGHRPIPQLVILSQDGNVDFAAPAFAHPDLHVILATTTRGAAVAAEIKIAAQLDIHALGEQVADLTRLCALLLADYGIKNLLCEGGSRVFANMLDQGLIDEEFVTWCPTLVGRGEGQARPSYTEGVGWMPDTAPYSKPLSLHRGGDCIFMRTRCQYI